MRIKKKTDRMLRDEKLENLEEESDRCLEALLQNVAHKHENGGVFENKEHHKQTCLEMKVISEEDLDGGTSTT